MKLFFIFMAFAMFVMSAGIYVIDHSAANQTDFSIWSAVCLIIGYLEVRK